MKIRNFSTITLSPQAETSGGGLHPSSHEILHIISGKVRFRWRENHCEAEAPAVFLLLPSTPHIVEAIDQDAICNFWELDNINTLPLNSTEIDVWNSLQSNTGLYLDGFFNQSILQSADFLFHLSSIRSSISRHTIDELTTLEITKLHKLVRAVIDSRVASSTGNEVQPHRASEVAVDIMINYLECRFKEPIHMSTLVDLVHLTPSYLIRVFRKYKGVTPFEYLRQVRLRAAESYLIGSKMPIRTIVEETGFGSIHYFSRLFKDVYGESPAKWRNAGIR